MLLGLLYFISNNDISSLQGMQKSIIFAIHSNKIKHFNYLCAPNFLKNMNFVQELKWRGMIHDIMPGTEEQLQKTMTTAYVGIDPTADSLHIGHLVSVMMLKHFQVAGHKPVVLVGGATGMIGDPSMKSTERNLLDEKTLRHNQECIKNQLSRFLDFNDNIPNNAEMVNNYDWMKEFTFLDFIRDIGKHLTVNYMMAKDSVKKRLESDSR
jgi:tyrosyl-tRNA synthetase